MVSFKKKRSSLRFHLRFSYFSPKIRMFFQKKRSSLRFHLRFPFFSHKIRVFSKKNKVLNQNRSLKKHLQRIQNCICCFRGGTASFASPNIHQCSHGFHPAHTKEALRGNVAANNFHTAIIVRKAVSTTTFACFRGSPDKVSRRTVWEPLV